MGRPVKNLAEQMMVAVSYQVEIKASDFASGVYSCCLIVFNTHGTKVFTKQMVVMK